MNHPPNKTPIQGCRCPTTDPGLHLDAGRLQGLHPATRHPGIGVFHGTHDSCHAGLNQRGRTGRRAALMGTGLQGQVYGRARRRRAGGIERVTFSVRLSRALVPTLAHHLAIPHDDAPHAGIGIGGIEAAPRQLQRARHITGVGAVGHDQVSSSGNNDICSRSASTLGSSLRR